MKSFLSGLFQKETTPTYSQEGQDRYLDSKIFRKKRDGFFIEIGAYDGIRFSNTYLFEKERGWKGICIEPIPERFDLLRKNRNAVCIQACVSEMSGTADFLKIKAIPR